MPLEAGSVFVRIAGLFDNSEFSKADRAVAQQRAAAQKPIDYKIGIDDSSLASDLASAKAKVAAADMGSSLGIPGGSGGGGGSRGVGIPGYRAGMPGGGGSGGGGGPSAPIDHTHSNRPGVAGVLGNLLHTKGGPFGLGGFTLGSMVGLGPEHLLGTGVSFAGSLGPAAAGGTLAAGGGLLSSIIGAGSDKLVMHQTTQEIGAIGQAMDKVQLAQVTYGKNSVQAARATAQLNGQLALLKSQGVSPAAVKAINSTAKALDNMKQSWATASSPAQVKAAGLLKDVIGVGSAYTNPVANAANQNIGILRKALAPFFSWLKGPQGMGLFMQLEGDFARKLPTSIHASTQAFELIVRMLTLAANQGGKFTKSLDKFFSTQNAKSTAQLGVEVNKLLASFHQWTALLKAIGIAFMGIIHSGNGEGSKLVVMLTNTVDKFNAWERSAKGATTLKSFFSNRSSEMGQLLHILGSVIVLFGQFYLSVQPIVPVVTAVLSAIAGILGEVKSLSEHSTLFKDMFVVPLGAFLLSWKLFSLETTIGWIKKLGTAILVLTGIREKDVLAQDAQMGEGAAKGGVGLARRALGGIAGSIPLVGGYLQKKISGGSGGMGSEGDKIGGATGMGKPGSRTNPLVITPEAGKFAGMGSLSSDAQKAEGAAGNAANDATLASKFKGLLNRIPGVNIAGGAAEAAGASSVVSRVAAASGGQIAIGAAENAGTVAAGLGTAEVVGAGGAAVGGAGLMAGAGAAIAAALPPVAIAAAIGGAIYLGIKLFSHKDPATFAGTASRSAVTEFTAQGHKQTQQVADTQKQIDSLLKQAHTAETGTAGLGAGGKSIITPPTAAEMAKSLALYRQAGQTIETQLQAGWNQYATKDAPTMLTQFFGAFKGQKTQTQAAGAEQMLAYAQGLEKNGDLPKGSVAKMLKTIEAEFPALIPILGKSAKSAALAITDGLDMKNFTTSWKATMSQITTGPNSMMDIASIMGNAGSTIQDKWGAALRALPSDTRGPLTAARTIARTNLQSMISDAEKFLPLLPSQYAQASTKVKAQILDNMNLTVNGISALVKEGVIKTADATKQIVAILTGELRAVAPLITATIQKEAGLTNQKALTAYIKYQNVGATGQRHAGANAQGGRLPGYASGGMAPGSEYGYGDRMTLVDPAGRARATMAGDESIYTRHQRPEVDRGLQAIGYAQGSKDLWRSITRPHGYSGGGAMDYAGGGGLGSPAIFAGQPLANPGHFTNALFHPAPGVKARAPRKAPTGQLRHSPTMPTSLATKLGLRGVTNVDNEVGRLDNQYTSQDNLFMLYDGASGTLPTKDLQILMNIRDEQFGLLWHEWKILPKALKKLDSTVYGTRGPAHGMGGLGGAAAHAGPLQGGVAQASKHLEDGVLALEKEIIAIQNNAAVSARTVQLAQQGQSQAALNAAAANAGGMAGNANALTGIHNKVLGVTQTIGKLQASLPRAGANTGNVQQRIAALKAQRTTLSNSTAPISAKLKAQATTNRTNAIAMRQQGYNIAWAAAASRYALAAKLRGLRATLAMLKVELAKELKQETQDKSAIGNLRTRLFGDSTGTNSLPQELSDYGYNILDLQQQGAKIHPGRLAQITKVYKSLGEQIPLGMGKAGLAGLSDATTAFNQLQGFEAAVSQSFLQFGSNFVAAGANPFGTQAQKLAGVTNYGAASSPVRAQGGPLPPPPPPTPYGGKGDTNINITQHFARGPSDAHSYSNGLKWELGATF